MARNCHSIEGTSNGWLEEDGKDHNPEVDTDH